MASEWDWDSRKYTSNILKHGINFADAIHIFGGIVVEGIDSRTEYDETRWLAIGVMDRREIVVIYTERGERRRMISARRATHHERQNYWKHIGDR